MLLREIFFRICTPEVARSWHSQFRLIMARAAQPCACPYSLAPLPVFGMEVHGIDLKNPVPDQVVDKIKKDVTK
jgi:hypothetical protein